MLPPSARTASGLGPDGTLFCRQTYFASPEGDEQGCILDGHGITAPLLHAIDPEGAARVWLEAPLAFVRIGDCGNDERPIARPPSSLIARLAPDLASAPRAEAVDLRAVSFTSCAVSDLELRLPRDVELTRRGAILRIDASTPSEVSLVVGDAPIRTWSMDGDDLELELEVLCNERFAIVAAGTIGPEPSGATTRDETLPCAPQVTRGWRSFERLRIDLASHVVTSVAFDPPRLSTER